MADKNEVRKVKPNVQMEETLYERIKQIADSEGLNFSAFVRQLLVQEVKKRDSK